MGTPRRGETPAPRPNMTSSGEVQGVRLPFVPTCDCYWLAGIVDFSAQLSGHFLYLEPSMNKQFWIDKLSLVEHIEGGYFSETYRATEKITTSREGSTRAMMTSIYYLLTDDRPVDLLHKNQSDIMHYFHAGSPITYILVDMEGNLHKAKLGLDLNQGEVPQLIVPGGFWKAAVLESGEYGLIGEAVAPGFDYRDMTIGNPDEMRTQFPTLWDELAPYVRS
jgi:uncharacterized protein